MESDLQKCISTFQNTLDELYIAENNVCDKAIAMMSSILVKYPHLGNNILSNASVWISDTEDNKMYIKFKDDKTEYDMLKINVDTVSTAAQLMMYKYMRLTVID